MHNYLTENKNNIPNEQLNTNYESYKYIWRNIYICFVGCSRFIDVICIYLHIMVSNMSSISADVRVVKQ
jgi:hypothetical protein